jgi:hypothetical protein
MGSQIFKIVPDHKIVFSVLHDVCSLEEKHFLITEINYKQLHYGNRINYLYDYLRPFYFNAKQGYIDNGRSFTGFLTVLRQLSKVYCIPHTSKVVYGQGTYTRTLRIYIDRHNWDKLPKPESSTITRLKSIDNNCNNCNK